MTWSAIFYDYGLLAARPAAATGIIGYDYFATDDQGGRLYRCLPVAAVPTWVALARGVTQLPMGHASRHVKGGIDPIPARSVQATVDFGFADGREGDIAAATVSAAWIQADSIINCSPMAVATDDHDADDVVVEGLTAYAANIVAGIGFDVIARAPQGTWGRYVINARSD